MKNELRNLISGKIEARGGEAIQAASRYLAAGAPPGGLVKGSRDCKAQEAQVLTEFIEAHGLWVSNPDLEKYVTTGVFP